MIMDLDKVPEAIADFARKLPRFPDGRINYHGSDSAPVITVFVKYDDKILLMKRSDKVYTYRGKWNTVAGYLDEPRPLKYKILEELREEIGAGEDRIVSMKACGVYEFRDRGNTWIVHPVLVELADSRIKLDWEHTEYRWIRPEEMKDYDTVPHLEDGLKIVFSN